MIISRAYLEHNIKKNHVSEMLLRTYQKKLLRGELSAYDVVNKKEVNYPTLMKDLNSCNLKTKFGIATLFSFISVTKNIAPLQYMAHERGYALIPLDQVMQTAEQNHDPIYAGVAKKQHSDYC